MSLDERKITALVLALIAIAVAVPPGDVAAQDRLSPHCRDVGRFTWATLHCWRLAEAIYVVQPAVGLMASGPASQPYPIVHKASAEDARRPIVTTVSAHRGGADVGVLNRNGVQNDTVHIDLYNVGLELDLPLARGFRGATWNGIGAIGLLAGASFTSLPSDVGFHRSVVSWALGGKLGLLPGSGSAPAASVTATYRHFGNIVFGDSALVDSHGYFRISNASARSVRVVLTMDAARVRFALRAGAENYVSQVKLLVVEPLTGRPGELESEIDEVRTMLGAGIALRLHVAHVGLDMAWQQGGQRFQDAYNPARHIGHSHVSAGVRVSAPLVVF